MNLNTSNKKIVVLGSTGFVGKNIAEGLFHHYKVFRTTRNIQEPNKELVWFDLCNQISWEGIVEIRPDIIINAVGYGVVKTETNINQIYEVNYFKTVDFYNYISGQIPLTNILHIGTAFEYDLSAKSIHENSPMIPLTHYGISKLMASNYLLQKKIENPFVILRPFNMFGPYEDESKIVPYLILAQKNNKVINLSSGIQKRDYFFVGDLTRFVQYLIQTRSFKDLPQCINIGTGKIYSIKELSNIIASLLPTYEPSLWNWSALPQREGEFDMFYNQSLLAQQLGFTFQSIEHNLKHTIQYYWNL